MSEHIGENRIILRGEVADPPAFSHRNHGVDYYTVPLRVPRLSGTEDLLNLITADPSAELWQPRQWVELEGEVRSYNNRTGVGSRLVITVLVRAARRTYPGEGENRLVLAGVLCKLPVRRRTPLGREICDLLLAVNRPYGKSDYIPCICWGRNARYASAFTVGGHVLIWGRIQSREYVKKTGENQTEKRTAYEVSVSKLEYIE